jgi:hypothetical protein
MPPVWQETDIVTPDPRVIITSNWVTKEQKNGGTADRTQDL